MDRQPEWHEGGDSDSDTSVLARSAEGGSAPNGQDDSDAGVGAAAMDSLEGAELVDSSVLSVGSCVRERSSSLPGSPSTLPAGERRILLRRSSDGELEVDRMSRRPSEGTPSAAVEEPERPASGLSAAEVELAVLPDWPGREAHAETSAAVASADGVQLGALGDSSSELSTNEALEVVRAMDNLRDDTMDTDDSGVDVVVLDEPHGSVGRTLTPIPHDQVVPLDASPPRTPPLPREPEEQFFEFEDEDGQRHRYPVISPQELAELGLDPNASLAEVLARIQRADDDDSPPARPVRQMLFAPPSAPRVGTRLHVVQSFGPFRLDAEVHLPFSIVQIEEVVDIQGGLPAVIEAGVLAFCTAFMLSFVW